jgi:hypothetical protein
MAEYGYSLRQALWGISLNAVFALLPAQRARHGDDSMPGFADLAAATARQRARDFLTTHYRIVPD